MKVVLIIGALLLILFLIIVYPTMKISSKISRLEEAELEELELLKDEEGRNMSIFRFYLR